MQKRKWLALLLPLALLVLELLPFGAVLNFASPEEPTPVRKTFSYFSLTPFGYANFGPFLTALLTVALVLAVLAWLWRGKGLLAVRVLSITATATSLLPLLLGASYMSALGSAIAVLLALQTVLVCCLLRI